MRELSSPLVYKWPNKVDAEMVLAWRVEVASMGAFINTDKKTKKINT